MTVFRLIFIAALAIAAWVLIYLFGWFVADLFHRGFDSDATRVVATDVSVPKFPQPTTSSTTTTLAPTTTTAAVARTAPTVRAASVPVSRPALANPNPRTEDGAWSCGGDLPPCGVLDRENPQRDLTVYNGGHHHEPGYTGGNPEGDSTASGKWQFVRGTWNGFGGYINAADAPWQVQDEKARQLWDGGRGCSHWSWCGR